MALPETISVRYTEDEAEYVSLRPVVRQTFRMAELVDMILSVTGKDAQRIGQILRAGSVAYHGYRYWWAGFDVAQTELLALLSAYPEADPRRRFHAEDCVAVVLESGESSRRNTVEISRHAAARRWFSFRSFWAVLMEAAQLHPPAYGQYSYARRADIFVRELSAQESAGVIAAAQRLLPRSVRAQIHFLPGLARICFVCPRPR